LLNALGLTHGGSSTVHIYTLTIYRTTQLTTLFGRLSGIRTQSGQTNWEECGPCMTMVQMLRLYSGEINIFSVFTNNKCTQQIS